VDPDAVLAEIDGVVSALASDGVSHDEMEKARNGTETMLWCELETVDGKGEALGHYETTVGDFREVMNVAERLSTIGSDAVSAAAASYLRPSGRTVVSVVPEDES
jgi:predicted Zn-dependent peptidase